MKKPKLLISAISLIALALFVGNLQTIQKAYAVSDNLSTAITWDGNCNDDIYDNGSTTAYAYYANGDTIYLTVNNDSSDALEIGVKGQSPTPVAASGSTPVTIPLGDEAAIYVYSNSCSQTIESSLLIFGASGSASCTLQGKVWNVSVDYDGVAPTVSLYRGTTYVDDLHDTSGGPGAGNVNTTIQFSGESSAATYYLYDGSNSSTTLIGQATCPAYIAASSSPGQSSSTTTSHATTSQSSSSAPSTTPNTKSSAKSTPSTPATGTWDSNTDTVSGYSKHSSTFLIIYFIVLGLLLISTIAGTWAVFKKAGRPGWAAIIPVYGTWVVFEIADKPGWWSVLLFIPIVNILALVMYVVALIELAKKFSKGAAFAVFGLFIFWFVGWPLLGFNKKSIFKDKSTSHEARVDPLPSQ